MMDEHSQAFPFPGCSILEYLKISVGIPENNDGSFPCEITVRDRFFSSVAYHIHLIIDLLPEDEPDFGRKGTICNVNGVGLIRWNNFIPELA